MFSLASQLQLVCDFLSVLSPLVLARAAFACQAYTRALCHTEEALRQKPGDLPNYLTFLQQVIYIFFFLGSSEFHIEGKTYLTI